jgi:hypothetical protein
MRWPALLIVLGFGLAGCASGANWHPLGSFNVGGLTKDDLQPQVVPASYCYSNLTHSPDCYDVPLEPEVRRLMGYYGPDPQTRGFFGRRAF